MCEPVSITMGVMAASSMAMAMMEKQQAAKRSEDAADDAQDSANASFLNIAATENQRLLQDAALDSQSNMQVSRQAMEARATASVSAGEAGVGGQSVRGLLDSFSREEAQFKNTTGQNAQFREQQSSLRLEGADASRLSRINQANNQVTSRPGFLGAALRIGGAGAQSYLGAGGTFGSGAGTPPTGTPGANRQRT